MKCGGIDKRTGKACRFSQGHIGACASRTPLEKAQGAWDDWTEEDRKTERESATHIRVVRRTSKNAEK